MAERSLRLFVAIALPPPVRAAIVPALRQIAEMAPRAKPVPPENLHATLRFLGETEPGALPALIAAIGSAAERTAPFEVRVAGTGHFGARARPHVLYAGITTGASELRAAARAVSLALSETDAGGRKGNEQPPFTPHVTLARARGRHGDPDLAHALTDRGLTGRSPTALSRLDAGSFVVRSFALFVSEATLDRSQHQKVGACYRILREAPLLA